MQCITFNTMHLLGNVPSLEGGSTEQRERAELVIADIQKADGDRAAATFGIGLHNGFAQKLYGPIAERISDALQATQGGRACLSLGMQVYLRKRAEQRAEDAEQELRDLRRRRRLPPTATYMTWPVQTVELGQSDVLIRTSHNALRVVALAELEFLPQKRPSQLRP